MTRIIGSGPASTALMLAVAEAITGAELLPAAKTKPEPKFTHADAERIAKAEAKRARKAAKRLKGKQA